ncbi:MAG: ectoine/hydroxyectoine ABC transporter permease subunit EhuD [Candidatus Methylomirabilales bacterium]
MTEFLDWDYVVEIFPALLEGLWVTVQVALLAFVVAAVLGLILAIARRSDNRLISTPVSAFVEFIRSTPLLVQLYFFFFVLPRYGLRIPAFALGVLAIGMHYGTYTSEVYRAGIDAVERGQWEAAKALNFSAMRTWRGIILPQALPPMVPSLGNYLIGIFKETPQLIAITVVELLTTAQIIGSRNFRYLEPILMVGVLFFMVSFPASLLVQRLEARYAR